MFNLAVRLGLIIDIKVYVILEREGYIKIIDLDVRPSAENVPMKIHISSFVNRLYEIILTLVSVNENEQRVYKVCFLRT